MPNVIQRGAHLQHAPNHHIHREATGRAILDNLLSPEPWALHGKLSDLLPAQLRERLREVTTITAPEVTPAVVGAAQQALGGGSQRLR
ncbi:MAG: hypothetical protein R3B07_08075 [Polyangiaceae bacterium]